MASVLFTFHFPARVDFVHIEEGCETATRDFVRTGNFGRVRLCNQGLFIQPSAGTLPCRVVFVNYDHQDPRARKVLGYISIQPTLDYGVWTKPFTFTQGIMPDVFKTDTILVLGLHFATEFSMKFRVMRGRTCMVEQDLVVTPDRLACRNNIICFVNADRSFTLYRNLNHPAVAQNVAICDRYTAHREEQQYRANILFLRSIDHNVPYVGVGTP